jgi:hypothetical protein
LRLSYAIYKILWISFTLLPLDGFKYALNSELNIDSPIKEIKMPINKVFTEIWY